ncbi:MAG: DUF4328 domain-containing protein [Bacteroidota bacterium]
MSYYNWEKIVESYSESELKKIYHDKDREPSDKVGAVEKELVKRGFLSPDLILMQKPTNEDYIVSTSEISNTESNIKFAKIASTAVGLVLLMDIVKIISLKIQYDIFSGATSGSLTNEIISSNNFRQLMITLVYLFINLLSAIAFIFWFHRAYDNLHKRILNCEFDVGWAIGSWFVPILSLFRPYNIMSELVEKTNIILTFRGIEHRKKWFNIGLWWTFRVITHIISFRLGYISTSINEIIFFTLFAIIFSSLDIILGIITILMINRFSKNEDLLFNDEENCGVLQ